MIHSRADYNRIQDPAGKIGEDEPVFLIRAHDEIAPEVVRAWADYNEEAGGDDELSRLARDHADLMEAWQKRHGKKLADL